MTRTGGGVADVDTRLGAALAAAGVPDHGEEFWPALGARLIAEREAPAAPPFDPLARLEQSDPAPAEPDEVASPRRRERRRERPTALRPPEPVHPAVTSLAEHAQWVRPAPPTWRRRVGAATSALAVIAVLGAAVWVGATAEPGSPPPTAGRLAALMSENLTGSPYVLGAADVVGLGGATGHYTFVRSSSGSLRYRRVDHRSDHAYDSINGTTQRVQVSTGGAVDATTDIGVAPGPPDADGTDRLVADDELAATIRTLESSPKVVARSRSEGGAKRWVVTVRVPASADAPVDRIRVVVDQGRVLPVEVTRLVRGVVIHRTAFSNLRMVSTVRLDTFQVPLPAPVNPIPFDNGFRRSSLAEAGLLAGYPAVTPGWLPEGYELSTVAVAAGSPAGLQASGGGDNPPNQDVISISYRRGVDEITVTSRRATGAGTSWKDPFSSATLAGTRVQNVRLDGGRFLGTIVEQVTTPGTVPHLWGRTPDLVFTVAGDVEPSQLLRTANGLR